MSDNKTGRIKARAATIQNKKCEYKPDVFDIDSYVKTSIDDILDRDSPKVMDTLILSGGGMKGMAELGALHHMESLGILQNITTIAGSSAGSTIGLLLIIGYRPVEIYHFFMNADLKKFTNINAYNLFNKLGLDDGKRFIFVMKKFFRAKGVDPNIKFKQLYRKTKKILIVTGACVNDKNTYYFSHETEPNMRVMDALRISVSIPIVYTPRKFKGKVFIDGGITDNYPISMFKHKIDQVIGIYVSEEKKVEEKISSIESFMKNMMECLREGVDSTYYRGYEARTIFIKCHSGEDRESISAMFDTGYRESIKYFKRLEVKEE
jgi:predicted acylesterase/phospholipase RssA